MSEVWLAFIESRLNAELVRRPSALQECAALQGRCLAIDVTGPELIVYVVPHGAGVQLMTQPPGRVTATVRGTPAALLRLAGSEPSVASLREAGVDIAGDAVFAGRLQAVLSRALPDPEATLAELLGDSGAHALVRGVGALHQGLRRVGDTLTRDMAEYLQYESRDLPVADEVADFVAAVDRTRDDVARLQARVQRLERDAGKAR